MTNPEEGKKLVVRPRKIDFKPERLDKPTESIFAPPPLEPVSEPVEPSPRKRPSHALRPAESAAPRKESAASAAGTGSLDSSPNPASVESGSRRGSRSRRSKGLRAPVPMGVALALAIVLMVVSGFFFYAAGSRAGFQKAESAAVKAHVDLPLDFLARLDAALADLQNGDAKSALEQFQALEKEQPDLATMSLLIANASVLLDDPATAQDRIAESIRRRESVSNALTLQAIVEAKLATDSDYKKMGSPKVRIEQLLRQAIAADSTNARPYFELATLKRFEGNLDEAEALLLSAQVRINATDSRTVTDAALALTRLQKLADSALRIPENPAPTPDAMFAAAYTAMRLGDTEKAKQFLESAHEYFPANVSRQILKDPAFIPYARKPDYEAYFQKTDKTRNP